MTKTPHAVSNVKSVGLGTSKEAGPTLLLIGLGAAMVFGNRAIKNAGARRNIPGHVAQSAAQSGLALGPA